MFNFNLTYKKMDSCMPRNAMAHKTSLDYTHKALSKLVIVKNPV
jgi:hypothetical protein